MLDTIWTGFLVAFGFVSAGLFVRIGWELGGNLFNRLPQ